MYLNKINIAIIPKITIHKTCLFGVLIGMGWDHSMESIHGKLFIWLMPVTLSCNINMLCTGYLAYNIFAWLVTSCIGNFY